MKFVAEGLKIMSEVVSRYLSLMDSQRESAFAALDGLTDSQLWQRPAPREWGIGEILDHNSLLIASMLPAVQWMRKLNGWYGRLKKKRPYATRIEDVYRDPRFPQWVGFLLHYDDVIEQVAQFRK